MLWVLITLMVSMGVSILLDAIDSRSEGNRISSLAIRAITCFICLIAILDKYAS
jgi:hypothetical protein